MQIKTKFVLNRTAFRNEILKDFGDAEVVKKILPAVQAVAPTGTHVETSTGKSRVRIRIVDEGVAAADRESKSGALSQALNRIRL